MLWSISAPPFYRFFKIERAGAEVDMERVAARLSIALVKRDEIQMRLRNSSMIEGGSDYMSRRRYVVQPHRRVLIVDFLVLHDTMRRHPAGACHRFA